MHDAVTCLASDVACSLDSARLPLLTGYILIADLSLRVYVCVCARARARARACVCVCVLTDVAVWTSIASQQYKRIVTQLAIASMTRE